MQRAIRKEYIARVRGYFGPPEEQVDSILESTISSKGQQDVKSSTGQVVHWHQDGSGYMALIFFYPYFRTRLPSHLHGLKRDLALFVFSNDGLLHGSRANRRNDEGFVRFFR